MKRISENKVYRISFFFHLIILNTSGTFLLTRERRTMDSKADSQLFQAFSKMWPLQGFLLPLVFPPSFPPPPFPSSLPPPPRNDPLRCGTELRSECVPFVSFSPFTNATAAAETGFFGLDQKANLGVGVSVLLWWSVAPCQFVEADEGPGCLCESGKCSSLVLRQAP